MSRLGSFVAVLAGSAVYIAAVLFLSVTWFLRRAHATRAAQPPDDFLITVQMSPWWWAVLLLPPLVVVAWWVIRTMRRGA